jgi:hypothetical protein
VQNFRILSHSLIVFSGGTPSTKYLLIASGIISGARPFPRIGVSMNNPFFLMRFGSCVLFQPVFTPT